MKLSFIVPSLWLSGGTRVVVEYARRLAERGHQVSVVAPRGTGDREMLEELGDRVQLCWTSAGRQKSLGGLQMASLAWSLARATPPSDHIVTTHTSTTPSGLIASRLLRRGRLVWLYQDYREMFLEMPWAEWLTRHALRWHDRALVVSEDSRRELQWFFPGEVQLVGEGLSHDELLHPAPVRREPGALRRLLYLGDERPRKGLAEFIEAAEIVARTGTAVQATVVSKDACDIKSELAVELIRRPSRQELALLYAGCDVFVGSSWWESFGLPPLEAMACGAPVVLADSRGVHEYANPGENCLMVQARDAGALAAAIERVLTDDELAARLRRAGPSTASRFTWKAATDRFEAAVQGRAPVRPGSHSPVFAVILNWNHAVKTLACVSSVRAAGITLERIAIVDNGSTDDSVRVLREQLGSESVLLCNEENLGFAAGANRGIEYALESGAGSVLVLNNDATIAPDTVEQLLRAREHLPSQGILAPAIYRMDQRSRLWRLGDRRHAWLPMPLEVRPLTSVDDRNPIAVDYVTGCAMLLSRKLLERVGAFDERFFFYGEDADLCRRARDRDFEVWCVPRARAWHEGEASARELPATSRRHRARGRVLFFRLHSHGPSRLLTHLFVAAKTCLSMVADCTRLRPSLAAATWRGAMDGARVPLESQPEAPVARKGLRACFIAGREATYSRIRVMLAGMETAGISCERCLTRRRSLLAAPRNFLRFLRRKGQCDFIVVGFLGQFLVPLVRLFTRKPILFDAFVSVYQTLAEDRRAIPPRGIRAWLARFVDRLSCRLADDVLLDTQEHVDYFVNELGLQSCSFHVLPASADDRIFSPQPEREAEEFLVHVHGEFQALHGLEHILEAARLLPRTRFQIVGTGKHFEERVLWARERCLTNIDFRRQVPYEDLPALMGRAAVCLGIFGDTAKAARVLPQKAVEAMAVERALITMDSPAARETLTHEESALLCAPGSGPAIAQAIERLQRDPALRRRLARTGRRIFEKKCSPQVVGRLIVELAESRARLQGRSHLGGSART